MINERAIIVALSYIIGFTTAFIGFGITPDKLQKADYNRMTFDSVSDNFVRANLTATTFNTYQSEDGLFIEIDGDERIITARATGAGKGPGFHYDIPHYETSPNMQFIHYCEQSTEIPTECTHYIYVTDNHIVYPVEIGGEGVVSQISSLHTHWLNDGRLEIGPFLSMSADEPWMLAE